MFIRLINGLPQSYTLGQLRVDNPGISFPDKPPAETLAAFDVYPVQPTTPPALDSKTQRPTSRAELINGVWTQIWEVLPLPEDQASANVRAHRDSLLAKSDWVVVKASEQGVPVPADWGLYRQALRDITAQQGFPYAVDWPVRPE